MMLKPEPPWKLKLLAVTESPRINKIDSRPVRYRMTIPQRITKNANRARMKVTLDFKTGYAEITDVDYLNDDNGTE